MASRLQIPHVYVPVRVVEHTDKYYKLCCLKYHHLLREIQQFLSFSYGAWTFPRGLDSTANHAKMTFDFDRFQNDIDNNDMSRDMLRAKILNKLTDEIAEI